MIKCDFVVVFKTHTATYNAIMDKDFNIIVAGDDSGDFMAEMYEVGGVLNVYIEIDKIKYYVEANSEEDGTYLSSSTKKLINTNTCPAKNTI